MYIESLSFISLLHPLLYPLFLLSHSLPFPSSISRSFLLSPPLSFLSPSLSTSPLPILPSPLPTPPSLSLQVKAGDFLVYVPYTMGRSEALWTNARGMSYICILCYYIYIYIYMYIYICMMHVHRIPPREISGREKAVSLQVRCLSSRFTCPFTLYVSCM